MASTLTATEASSLTSNLVDRLNRNKDGVLVSLDWYQLGLVQYQLSTPLPLMDVWTQQEQAEQVCKDLKVCLMKLVSAMDFNSLTSAFKAFLGLSKANLPLWKTWTVDDVQDLLRHTALFTHDETREDYCHWLAILIFQPKWELEEIVAILHACHEHAIPPESVVRLADASEVKTSLDKYDSTERMYVESLLESSIDEEIPQRIIQDDSASERVDKPRVPISTSAQDALQIRIDQIRQILPDLGEGYVETILSYFSGEVERAVAALLEGNLPDALKTLDTTLPRRRRSDDDNDDQARQANKEAILAMERAQEVQAIAIEQVMLADDDVYNDDFFEDDYEAVKTYNQAVKEWEGDEQFWSELRNTNHASSSKKSGKQFGPDKIRGGRIPQRKDEAPNTDKKNESDGKANDSQETKPTRSQQRRKQQKLANRRNKQKDRAAR